MDIRGNRKAATVFVNDFYKWLKVVAKIKWASDLHIQSGNKEYVGPRWIFRG